MLSARLAAALMAAAVWFPGGAWLAAQDAGSYWSLVHDRAVLDDLKLTSTQRAQWRRLLDPLDLECFPLRNQPAATAEPQLIALVARAKEQLGGVLKPTQAQRLQQILVRAQGTAALLDDGVAERLALTDEQRTQIRDQITQTRAAQAKAQRELIAAQITAAEADQEINRLSTEERDALVGLLTTEQKSRLGELLPRDFDARRLGDTAFKTPDLIGGPDEWLNSPPLAPDALRGQVVVVHFFAFGCSNCIHNYPSYRKWQQELTVKGVRLIGIHTPETEGERNVETLRGKLKAEQLSFPVIVDNDRANWTAWGNGIWPAVYVLDRRGDLRAHWPGELKWQGRDGEAIIEQKIRALLAES